MYFKNWNGRELNIREYVLENLDGSDYDSGQLETLSRTVDNISGAFARLVEHLVSKNLMNKEEVQLVIKGFVDIYNKED